MQVRIVFLGVLHRGEKSLVLKEIPVADGFADAGQLLVNDAARADVGVADLGVAHLPVREADVHAGSADFRHGVIG